jgi:GDSL-like Lipase/Acylhydrolase family
MRLAFIASLLTNLAALGAASMLIRRRGGIHWLTVRLHFSRPPATDYAAIARKRFAESMNDQGGTIYWGDSMTQNAPLLEILAGSRQWGIGGQQVRELAGWADAVIAAAPSRLVVWAGINDLLVGRSASDALADLGTLLAMLRGGLPDTEILVVSLPPVRAVSRAVADFNSALPEVCAAAGAKVVDVGAALPADWTSDGVHLSRAAYLTVGHMFE